VPGEGDREGPRGARLRVLDSSETTARWRLNLGSGGTPFGEMHAVYRPRPARSARRNRRHPRPAWQVRGLAGHLPVNPAMQQAVELEGAAYGFHKDSNGQGAFRPPPAAAVASAGGPDDAPPPDAEVPPDADAQCGRHRMHNHLPFGSAGRRRARRRELGASRIKLYGTATFPSPDAVLGNVAARGGVDLEHRLDRDGSADDENAQSTAAGKKLPVADAHEPVLVSCDEGAFRADLSGESAAVVTYRRLHPFGEQGPGHQPERNVDSDGDGVAETPVLARSPRSRSTHAVEVRQPVRRLQAVPDGDVARAGLSREPVAAPAGARPPAQAAEVPAQPRA